ncbi:MAG: DNA repair protein RecN [Chloroflexi bacterium]|nr:DNA repair protein RecN [Chloroflexota bacterium]
MLLELNVKNLAIIHETNLTFGPGFNVITGETGAGKSLLIDALEFVLGENSNRDLLRNQTDSTSVEAVFSIAAASQLHYLETEFDINCEEDGLLVIFRKLHIEGKVISKINGQTVTIKTLKAIANMLVDIHGQGSHLSLVKTTRQLQIIDTYKGLNGKKKSFEKELQGAINLQKEINSIAELISQNNEKADLYKFQLKEIEESNIKPDEESQLVIERELLYHSTKIIDALENAYLTLQEQDNNIIDLLGHVVTPLQRCPDPSGFIQPKVEVLLSLTEQLKEISRELKSLSAGIEADEARLDYVENRIELLKNLKRKYGQSEEQVNQYANQLRDHVQGNDDLLQDQKSLNLSMKEAWQLAGEIAISLSDGRKKAAKSLEEKTQLELAEVGLEDSVFQIEISNSPSTTGLPSPNGQQFAYNSDGIDFINFLLSPNPGEQLKPLSKIASGGETSRAMLAINSAIQSNSTYSTLIFDEIDSGIGGRLAEIVGKKLWSSSKQAQVLCVTHLPQIAAFADSHFKVEKSVIDERTYASARELNKKEKILELAEMLGNNESETLANAAAELLTNATSTKNN